MEESTITLSKDDLRLLLKHVYLGNWVLTATKEERIKEEEAFYQRFLKLMSANAIESRIEKDKKLNEYFVSEDLEDEYLESIDEYNEDTFYEELVDRLAKKDLTQSCSAEELEKMNELKFNKLFDKEQEKYVEEINAHGIDNIGIVKKA